jgi:hypothetical protein
MSPPLMAPNARFKTAIVSVFLPLSFMLSQYRGLFGLSWTFLGLLALLAVLAVDGRIGLRAQKDFLVFIAVVAASVALSVIRGGGIWFNVYLYPSAAVLVLGVLVTSRYVDHRLLWRVYWLLGGMATVVMFYQAVVVYGTGAQVSPVSILPIAERDIRLWQPAHRPSSFFTEPQYYATFMLPLFLNALVHGRHVRLALVGLSILLSASSFGVLSMLILLAWNAAVRGVRLRHRVAALSLALGLVLLLQSFDLFAIAYEKILRIDIATDDRLAKALILVLAQPVENILFGLPMPVETYILQHLEEFPFLWVFVGSELERLLPYLTTFFGVLLVYGVFAWLALVRFWVKMYGSAQAAEQRGVLILVVIHSIATGILFNYPFYFYYTLLLSYPTNGGEARRFHAPILETAPALAGAQRSDEE